MNKPKDGHSIDNILAGVGKYYDADRSYIIEFNKDRTTASKTYEWCREGVASEIDVLKDIPLAGLEKWLVDLKEKGEFYISSRSEEYPPESATYRILKPQGIESLAASPLILNGSVIGC